MNQILLIFSRNNNLQNNININIVISVLILSLQSAALPFFPIITSQLPDGARRNEFFEKREVEVIIINRSILNVLG